MKECAPKSHRTSEREKRVWFQDRLRVEDVRRVALLCAKLDAIVEASSDMKKADDGRSAMEVPVRLSILTKQRPKTASGRPGLLSSKKSSWRM